MSSCQKSKRRIKPHNLRQVALLLFAFSQLVVSRDATRQAAAKIKESLSQRELAAAEEDIAKLDYIFKEMRTKLSMYSYLAPQAQAVSKKVLQGLNATGEISNIEVFAVLMLRYFEDVRPKLVSFSARFKEIVAEIDLVAYDDVGTAGVRKAGDIAHKIFERIMLGDYLEFKQRGKDKK